MRHNPRPFGVYVDRSHARVQCAIVYRKIKNVKNMENMEKEIRKDARGSSTLSYLANKLECHIEWGNITEKEDLWKHTVWRHTVEEHEDMCRYYTERDPYRNLLTGNIITLNELAGHFLTPIIGTGSMVGYTSWDGKPDMEGEPIILVLGMPQLASEAAKYLGDDFWEDVPFLVKD